MTRPLEGLRVLDMADEKGEFCGRLFADLGADVVRAEPPAGGLSRSLAPFAPDGRTSLYFAVRNAGKRGVTLDLATPDGRSKLDRLLASCDVWIESHRPGELAAVHPDLAPDRILARHPHLVLSSISDFGQTGPYRDYKGTDMIGFAMGGMMHRSGSPARPPCVAPGALAYDSAGVTAAYATLLAYWKRLRTGRGQHVDVSVYESVANLADWSLPNYSLRRDPAQKGARAGTGIYALYGCADGFVRMVILVKHHWHALLDWMGNPAELQDPELDVFIQRLIQSQRINPVIEAFFRPQKKIDVAREAQSRGIPATPLLEPGQVLENEHTRARKSFADLPVGGGFNARVPSGFLELNGGRAGPTTGPPDLGADDADLAKGFPAREAVASASAARVDHPLSGLRVIDFGVGAVGVEIGRLLAEYGADVIKIESGLAPDFIRVIMNSWMNPNFASSSRSKRSFGVNVKTDRGLELVHELVRDADVAIENNGAGVMERLGLDYGTLSAINPRLVMFSSQMVGSSGPWAHWIGYGPSTHPVAGLQYLWNYPEDEAQPAGSTNVYPDHLVGRLGAFAVLAGLVGRESSGRGLHAEAAQFETAIQYLGDLLAQESLAPGSVRPLGNASQRGAPWGCYPCAGDDEWCAVNVRNDDEWLGLCTALGDPRWTHDPGYATAEGRRAAAATIDERLAEWTGAHSPRDVMEALQAHGVPAGMLQHGLHQLEDPHLAARGYLREVDQPDCGSLVFEGPAFHGSDLPEPIIRPAPGLGEHTRELAAERLGLSLTEIEDLVAKGILEDGPPPD